MRHSTSLSSVLLQLYNPDRTRQYVRWSALRIPWPFVRRRRLVKLMCSCKVQSHSDSLVRGSIADQYNLPPSMGITLSPTSLQHTIAAASAWCAMMSILLFQVLNCFFQHSIQSMLLIVCRNDQRHEAFGIGDLVRLLWRYYTFFRHSFHRKVVVVPTWQRLRLGYLPVNRDCYVLLFGSPRWSRRGSEQGKQYVQLVKCVSASHSREITSLLRAHMRGEIYRN